MEELIETDLIWKVNTCALMDELFNNPGVGIMKIPFQIFKSILAEVADRAAELNDPKLNALMCRLALYEISDQYSKEYDSELVNKTIKDGYKSA